MACSSDVNFSSGSALLTIETDQTETGGGLVAGALSTHDIYCQTIPLTSCVSTSGKTTKLVGFDFILDNNGSAMLPEDLFVYVFDDEPLVVTTEAVLVPNAAFSTMNIGYFQFLVAKIELDTIAIEAGHPGALAGTANELQITNYCETASDSTTLYAVIVCESTTGSTIAAGATLKTRFKFEGVMS